LAASSARRKPYSPSTPAEFPADNAPRAAGRAVGEQRLERVRELFEFGDVDRTEYVRRRDELRAQKRAVAQEPRQTSLVLQRQQLGSLVDDSPSMTIDERRRLVAMVFHEIGANSAGISWLCPRDDWKGYVAAVVPVEGRPLQSAGLTERKTGVKRAEVITARLVQDEGGWLRLTV
jgi:hypothetical protein